jgi:hypothetical protein
MNGILDATRARQPDQPTAVGRVEVQQLWRGKKEEQKKNERSSIFFKQPGIMLGKYHPKPYNVHGQ